MANKFATLWRKCSCTSVWNSSLGTHNCPNLVSMSRQLLQAICFKSHAQRVVGLSIQLKALMKALGHFSVFVSYIWGAYFFKEPIKDHILALVALAIMAIGMAGVGSAGSGNNLLSVAPNLWMSALRLPDEEEVGGTALLSVFALFLDCLHQDGCLF